VAGLAFAHMQSLPPLVILATPVGSVQRLGSLQRSAISRPETPSRHQLPPGQFGAPSSVPHVQVSASFCSTPDLYVHLA
jgi:hypothetical protein